MSAGRIPDGVSKSAQRSHQSSIIAMAASSPATDAGGKRNRGDHFRPQKRQCPGSLKAAVGRLFDQAGGVSRVQILLRKGKSQVYAYADDQSEHEMHLSQAAALTAACHGTALAEYFSALADGVFLPLGADAGASALHALTAEAARRSGAAIADMIEALRDGRIEAHESLHAVAHIDETMRALAALRSAVLQSTAEGEDR